MDDNKKKPQSEKTPADGLESSINRGGDRSIPKPDPNDQLNIQSYSTSEDGHAGKKESDTDETDGFDTA